MFYAIIFNAADEGWCGQDYRGVNFDSIAGFFLDISKKTQGQKNSSGKKTQANFRKSQANYSKTQ